MEDNEAGALPMETYAEEYMDNEKIIIKEKIYQLFLDKDEYKLIMSINNLKEIIFSLTQLNIFTPYYYESTYSLQEINEISKLLDKTNIEDIFNYYDEELFTKKKVKLSDQRQPYDLGCRNSVASAIDPMKLAKIKGNHMTSEAGIQLPLPSTR